MDRKLDHDEVRGYLAAFADGELDVEQNLRVLEHMAMDPQSTRRVMHQQQLRQAVGRVIRGDAPGAPADLRGKVEAALADVPATNTPRSTRAPRSVLAVIGRWAPAAVAAVLLVSALTVLRTADSSGPAVAGADVLFSAAKVQEFGRRHVSCSRMLDRLHGSELFPRQVSQLPGALTAYLGDSGPVLGSLDLTGLGYRFVGAGKCLVPGTGSVHLVYEAAERTARSDSLSLWIRAYDGKTDIEPGKLYTASGPSAVHPVLVWRVGDVVYYLVGDGPEQTRVAAERLRSVG